MQIMLEEMPALLKEQLVIPSVLLNSDNIDNGQTHILNRIKMWLESIGCDGTDLNESCCKSVYLGKSTSFCPTVLVDISSVDINYLYLERNSLCWFVLPIEIMNAKKVCNIEIDKSLQLSLDILDMTRLYNPETSSYYPLPDVCYGGTEFNDAKFKNIFGMNAQTFTDHKYYVFDKSFNGAVKVGGWSKSEKPEYKFDKLITDNDYGRYCEGGINRYVLFQGKGNILNKEDVDEKYMGLILEKLFMEYDHIYLFDKKKDVMQVIIKDYDLQYPLTYHKLDKHTLGYKWTVSNEEYCIR